MESAKSIFTVVCENCCCFNRLVYALTLTAKVILTVRSVDDAWDTASALSPNMAAKLDSSRIMQYLQGYVRVRVTYHMITEHVIILKPHWHAHCRYIWSMKPDPVWKLTKRHFMRHYWRHNAKVIHGVPRAQLLVLNVFDSPGWGPLCKFLGVAEPDVPFPTPSPNEY